MKVLLLSLLRMGDILLLLPTLSGLKKRHPHIEIHLVINKQFRKLVPLIPFVDQFHFFDREELQKDIGEYHRPLLSSVDRLDTFIKDLSVNYDQIINVTHTRLSGYLMGLLSSREKVGLTLDVEGQASFGNPWFRYLNDYPQSSEVDSFHFVDVFFSGSGLSGQEREFVLSETKVGKKEAAEVLQGAIDPVLVQVFSNESKKEWANEELVQSLQIFQSRNPQAPLFILGAPFEQEKLETLIDKCRENGVRVLSALCGIEAAYSLIVQARLLLTCDTSIKHLANASDCKVIELSLGSSHFRQTGIYKPGNLILQSKEPCAPCSHTTACPYSAPKCQNSFHPELVAGLMEKMYKEQTFSRTEGIKNLEKAMRESHCEVFLTANSSLGYWMAVPIISGSLEALLSQWINKASVQFQLERHHWDPVSPYGSTTRALLKDLFLHYSNWKPKELTQVLDLLESRSLRTQESFDDLRRSLREQIKQSLRSEDSRQTDWADHLIELQQMATGGAKLWEGGSLFADENPFRKGRALHNRVETFRDFRLIREKVLKSLKQELEGVMDPSVNHV